MNSTQFLYLSLALSPKKYGTCALEALVDSHEYFKLPSGRECECVCTFVEFEVEISCDPLLNPFPFISCLLYVTPRHLWVVIKYNNNSNRLHMTASLYFAYSCRNQPALLYQSITAPKISVCTSGHVIIVLTTLLSLRL